MNKRISFAAAGLVLAVCVPTSVAAAPAVAAGGPAVADGASVASATGSVGTVTAVKKKSKTTKKKSHKKSKKRVTIAWKTVKHKTSRKKGHKKYKGYHYAYTENLRVPYLKGASKKAKKTFNKAVNKKIASGRSWAKPTLKKYKYGCSVFGRGCGIGSRKPHLRSKKAASGIYHGRYASVAMKIMPYFMSSDDPALPRASAVTVDLKTGKLVKQKKFVKISKKKLNSKLKKAIKKSKKLKKQWCKRTCYFDDYDFGKRAWSVSKKGVTFTWYTGGTGGEAWYNGKITLPWKSVRK